MDGVLVHYHYFSEPTKTATSCGFCGDFSLGCVLVSKRPCVLVYDSVGYDVIRYTWLRMCADRVLS